MLKPGRGQAIVLCHADPFFAIIWLQTGFPEQEMAGEIDAMKTFTVAVAMLALIVMPAHAQMGGGGRRHQSDEKKTEQKPKVDEKAYKAALDRIPEPKEKYDPWGVARPAEPAKKPKQAP